MRVLCLYFPRIAIHIATAPRQDLRDRPVATLQGTGDTAVVASTSAHAASAGVVAGMSAAEARRRRPGTVFLPDNSGECFDRLDRLAAIIRIRATPLVAIGGADHLFVDLHDTGHLYASEEIAAARLAELAQSWLRVPVRAGVAPAREAALEAARAARFRPIVVERGDTAPSERPFASYSEQAVAVEVSIDGGRSVRSQVARLLARAQAVLDGRQEGFREARLSIDAGTAATHARVEGLGYDASELSEWLERQVEALAADGRMALRLELRRLCPDARVRPAIAEGRPVTSACRTGRQFPLRAAG